MKSLLHFSFLVPLAAFLFHQIGQKILDWSLPFLDFYLDPFCFGALIPPLLLIERKWLFKQTKFSKLEFVMLLLVLIIFSEVLIPLLSSNFTADPFDALGIFLGGCWYWWLGRNRK